MFTTNMSSHVWANLICYIYIYIIIVKHRILVRSILLPEMCQHRTAQAISGKQGLGQ